MSNDVEKQAAPTEAAARAWGIRDGETVERDGDSYALATRGHGPVNAAAYLQSFHHTALREIGAYLRGRPITPGHPDLRFIAESPIDFLAQLGQLLDVGDSRDVVLRLQRCLEPTDLYALIDRNRAVGEAGVFSAGRALDHDPYNDGPTGPRRWQPSVAIAIGSELERQLRESMARMAARYVAVAERKRQAAVAAGSMPEPVVASELVPAHPLDWYVARAFTEPPATVEPAGGTLRIEPGAEPDRHAVHELEWLSPPAPWNAVRPVRPAKASREVMARKLLGLSTEAYRLTQVGDFFIVPEEVAERFPEAVRHRTPIQGDAVHALATSGHGREIAAAEAPAATPPSTRGEVESLWRSVDARLHGLGLITAGLPGHDLLAGAIVTHQYGWLEVERLDAKASAERAVALRSQLALLDEIAAEVGDLTAGAQRHAKDDPGDKLSAGQRARLAALLRAASLSHLPVTGRAALQEVRAGDQAQVLAALEAQFTAAVEQLEGARQVREAAAVQIERSRDVFGTSLEQRRDELRGELALMAAALREGKATNDAFRALYGKLEGFRIEVSLIANFGAIQQILDAAEQLEGSNWVAASGGIDDLERVRGGGRTLQLGLGKILRIRRDAEARVSALRRRAEAHGDDPQLLAQAQRAALDAVAEVKAALAKLGGDESVRQFLKTAYETIDDAQTHAMILQVAVMIGVTLAVTVVSAGAGNLAEGAVVGMGGRGAVATGANMVTQSLTMTAMMTKLEGGSFGTAFLEDMATNLALEGVLRGFDRVFAKTRFGATVAAGPTAKGYRIAKVGELTGRTLTTVAAMYALEQYKSQVKHHRALSEQEHEQLATQGVAQAVGMAVLTRVLEKPLVKFKVLGARGGALKRQRAELTQLARDVSAHHDPQQALELLRGERAMLEAELAAWQELSALPPRELRKRGVEAELVEAMTGNLGGHLRSLDELEGGTLPAQLGLETIVPGRVFRGSQAHVDNVVESYRASGSEVKVHAEGDGSYRYEVVGHDGVSIELVAHAPDGPHEVGRPRPAGGTRATAAAGETAGGVDVSSPPGPRPAEHVDADLVRARGKAALTVGGVEVAGTHELRLVDGAEGVAVRVRAGDLGDELRSSVRLVDDGVEIVISSRASALEVERQLARRLTEGAHMVARRQVGKEPVSPDALGKDATGTFLSPADQGRVTELRVLRRQHAEEVATRGARSEQAALLEKAIDDLERRLDIADETPDAKRRRRMVETQVIVQDDHHRRAEARRTLDGDRGHPGQDLHNHFMGIVEVEVFRLKADVAANGKDTGSWLPLLGRLAGMSHLRHGRGPGGQLRSPAGDALEIVVNASKETKALQEASTEFGGQSSQRIRQAEEIAEGAVRTALTATDETEFNSAYELRDELVKGSFAGAVRPGATADEIRAHENAGYDEYTREALRRLARDGITYSEQSNSTKKLADRFTPERVGRIHEELVAAGELERGQLDVRFLSMLPTRAFGERAADVRNPEEVHPPRHDDATFSGIVAASGEQITKRADVVGRDVAGAEVYTFDGTGVARFQQVYRDQRARAEASGSPTVLRPHVGEGAVDNLPGEPFHRDRARRRTADGDLSHQARARENLEQMLVALEQLQARGVLNPQKVIVRFGHATMATPAQVERMRRLGVLAEINLGSNVRTGSADQTLGGVDGMTSPIEQYDDHVFGSAIYYGIDVLLSTDGHAVMRTTMRDEYLRARHLLEEIVTGERKVRVRTEDAGERGQPGPREGERWLSIEDFTPDERSRFLRGYEKLYSDARAYFQHRPRPDGTAGTPGLEQHWLGLASEHGLERRGVGEYEGTRAQVVAAGEAYRKQGSLSMYYEEPDGRAYATVTTADGRATIYLRERALHAGGAR